MRELSRSITPSGGISFRPLKARYPHSVNVPALIGCLIVSAAIIGGIVWFGRRGSRSWRALEANGVETLGIVMDIQFVPTMRTKYLDVEIRDEQKNPRRLYPAFRGRYPEIGKNVTLRFDPNDESIVAYEPKYSMMPIAQLIGLSVFFIIVSLVISFNV